MEAKHTAGPWRKAGGAGDGYSIIGPDNEVIASNLRTDHARLIAAAPDLLKTAVQIIDSLEHPPAGYRGSSAVPPWALAELKEAIAKVEGE